MCNFMQNPSVAVSWEPPNSSENIIEGNLQGSKLSASDVPESTTIHDKQCELKRTTVLTCGSHEEKILRTILANIV